ncbi:MAG: hypothetical protein D6824_00130 [Planctomycetota bacterium]|nr:MAG: hypothetical protein D6824_00130 [Planctomycetota bacterium]
MRPAGPLPQPTAWQAREEPTGRGVLRLENVRFTPTGPSQALLEGAVASALVEIHRYEARTEPYIRRRRFLLFEEQSPAQRTVMRNQEVIWKPVSPKRLLIRNPFGPSPVVDVREDGSFRAELEFDPPHVVVEPKHEDLVRSLFVYTNPSAALSIAPPAAGGVRWRPVQTPISLWRYELDPEKAARYARSQAVELQLETRDMLSRVPVNATITLQTLDGPTRRDIQRRLERHTHDPDAARELMRHVPELLEPGQRLVADRAGTLRAIVAAGSTVRLQTLHPAYLHFSRTLTVRPNRKGKVRTIILLPEKGRKVRVERVDDSLGGALETGRVP